MDENYLDNLLNDVSNEENNNKSFDATMNMDADMDIDLSDINDISLDELDNLDDVDLSELDLDDIDFDDVDITKLDAKSNQQNEFQDEDFSLDKLLDIDDNQAMAELFGDSLDYTQKKDEPASDIDDMDIDDLFSALDIRSDDGDIFGEAESGDMGKSGYTSGEDALDALFKQTMQDTADSGELDDIANVNDIKNKSSEKKTISEIIFGVPDEEELEEERIYEQKRAEKKERKAKEKEEKLAKKNAILEARKKENDVKKRNKDKLKKQKQEMLKAELEEEKSEKKVPVAVVALVFAIFAFIAGVVLFGSNHLNYTRIIHKAADYFGRQRYSLAYEEVSGVEVKEKDRELRDRIYTVMYVERLYNSYENNMAVNRPDKALDALLRGLEKYDEHYEEAVELDIVNDIDSCRDKIINALYITYGLTETQAYEIMKLSGYNYTSTLMEYSEALQTGE